MWASSYGCCSNSDERWQEPALGLMALDTEGDTGRPERSLGGAIHGSG